MHRLILALLFMAFSSLYSENCGECYLQIGPVWEKYHWNLKNPIILNSAFRDLDWKANALDCSIVARVTPFDENGWLAGTFFQIEGGGLVCGKGSDFHGNIQENNPPSIFSNEKSFTSKVRGHSFQFIFGCHYCRCRKLSIAPVIGYIQQERQFYDHHRRFFVDPHEEDVVSFSIDHFGDKKCYQAAVIGVYSDYHPIPCVCLRANIEYHRGAIKGHTRWNSEEIFVDGFSFHCTSKIKNKNHFYQGVKVKLGVEYTVWKEMVIGLNGYYQYDNSCCSNDLVEVKRDIVNRAATSFGFSKMSGKYKSKMNWQMGSINALLGFKF